MLTVGSLFAGIGGFDLGFERAGMETSWQVELDPYCRAVLAKHFPRAERYADVREVHGFSGCPHRGTADCAYCLGRVDVFAAGVPCQPISGAGKGLGDEDDRWMWPDTLRLVGELRPRYVVLENPSILLVRGLDGILGELAALGYDAEWSVVSACSVGAPHLRQRVFVVAYPSEERRERSWQDVQAPWPRAHAARHPQGSHPPRAWAQIPAPDLRGVADGIPNRVDRLSALGNALVPQVAELIGQRIVQYEEGCVAA